jgi:hypothetical protein
VRLFSVIEFYFCVIEVFWLSFFNRYCLRGYFNFFYCEWGWVSFWESGLDEIRFYGDVWDRFCEVYLKIMIFLILNMKIRIELQIECVLSSKYAHYLPERRTFFKKCELSSRNAHYLWGKRTVFKIFILFSNNDLKFNKILKWHLFSQKTLTFLEFKYKIAEFGQEAEFLFRISTQHLN